MKRIALALMTALVLAGCKSDEEKLRELRTEESLARLRLLAAERELAASLRYDVDCEASPAHQEVCEKRDSLRQEIPKLRDRVDLAERATRRFLR